MIVGHSDSPHIHGTDMTFHANSQGCLLVHLQNVVATLSANVCIVVRIRDRLKVLLWNVIYIRLKV